MSYRILAFKDFLLIGKLMFDRGFLCIYNLDDLPFSLKNNYGSNFLVDILSFRNFVSLEAVFDDYLASLVLSTSINNDMYPSKVTETMLMDDGK